jgi:hypothetical protein
MGKTTGWVLRRDEPGALLGWAGLPFGTFFLFSLIFRCHALLSASLESVLSEIYIFRPQRCGEMDYQSVFLMQDSFSSRTR